MAFAVELLDNLSRFPAECWVVQESFNALITRYVKSFEMMQLFLEICPGEVLPKIVYVHTIPGIEGRRVVLFTRKSHTFC